MTVTNWHTTPTGGGMLGFPVVTSMFVPNGCVYKSGGTFVVGVSATEIEEDAVRIVRAGLADVLRWCGQPVLTGRQMLERLRA